MAGGAGERFWPVSTSDRPKQFLHLSSPDKSLLQEAVDRAAGFFGTHSTYIATGVAFADLSRRECPNLDSSNVLAEPAKRNTAGCQVWVAANLIADNPNDWAQISIAVLTADHRISPTEGFHTTVRTALDEAERTGALVTIGIRPDRPETGYGYIELGESLGDSFAANSFREKPDLATAESYIGSGQYLWNSGMFFWTLPAFMSELERAQPEMAAKTREIAGLIRSGNLDQANEVFQKLPSISIDYALMEKAERIAVVEAQFSWDDLGSWDSLRRSFVPDTDGNVSLGASRILESKEMVVYNESTNQEVSVLGMEGVVVVVTDSQIMVCPAARTQEVRKLNS